MAGSFNPYAPPQSVLEAEPAAGAGVYRDGNLVRMEISGVLPDRCMRCNRTAEGYRTERTVYWRPLWWRAVIWGSFPVLFLFATVSAEVLILFWPTALGLAVADFFLRRKFVVAFGLCEGHRRLRTGILAAFGASWIALFALVAVSLRAVEHWWFWAVALTMFALGIVGGLLYRVGIGRLEGERMWLKGTGRLFRESLPLAS